MITVDDLQIKISQDTTIASKGIDALYASMAKLKSLARGGMGLNSTAKQLTKLSTAVKTFNASDSLSINKITKLVSSLNQLGSLNKSNLSSTINALARIPKMTDSLEKTNLDKFSAQIQRLTTVLTPLANNMNKISAGFASFPTRIQNMIKTNEKLNTSIKNSTKYYNNNSLSLVAMAAKITGVVYAMSRATTIISGVLVISNNYVENLNLFTVAMGEYALQAQEYAQTVQNAMGIDMSNWIRNQALFMQLASGFGVVSDAASSMSENLTKVAYDISSFYNLPIEEAVQKVKSGFAGELEPLRNLGYALDQATLQQIAFDMGIEQSIGTMTRAQKSQLLYIAIMKQSKNAIGDMARTIETPANSLRIFKEQLTLFQRALGNIASVLAAKVLPYIRMFVAALTEGAQIIADYFGFELPVIDYSSVNQATGALEDYQDEIESVKKSTIGLDELNVLGTTAADASTTAAGGEIDTAGYDYNFLGDLTAQTSELGEKMKEDIREVVTFILDNIKEIGIVLGA